MVCLNLSTFSRKPSRARLGRLAIRIDPQGPLPQNCLKFRLQHCSNTFWLTLAEPLYLYLPNTNLANLWNIHGDVDTMPVHQPLMIRISQARTRTRTTIYINTNMGAGGYGIASSLSLAVPFFRM